MFIDYMTMPNMCPLRSRPHFIGPVFQSWSNGTWKENAEKFLLTREGKSKYFVPTLVVVN